MFTASLKKALSKDFKKYLKNFINGKHVPTNGSEDILLTSPVTGQRIGNYCNSNNDDVNSAVNSAQIAFEKWSKTTYTERSEILSAIASKIKLNVEDIAILETLDTGKTIKETTDDVLAAAACFEYYAACALNMKDNYSCHSPTSYVLSFREPLGVCAGIGAWNFPFGNITWKIAPALCMGNTFVYKPSQYTPLTSVILAEICVEAGLPPGGVNIIHGPGTTGKLLCKHPGISKVSFTGSNSTGKEVAKECASTLKRVSLELGGKSPLIIFEDSCLEDAVNGAILANYTTQGQVCSNATKVYVHRSIYEEFKEKLVEATSKIKVGNPFSSDTDSGALISENHFNFVSNMIENSLNNGAKKLYGGERVMIEGECGGGFYMSPCILENCSHDMPISVQEVFGPVLCLYRFDSENEAVQSANNTVFGLAAGLFSRDIGRIHRISKELQAGTIYVNTYNMYPTNLPFGGRKQSGYGRENSFATLNDFSDLKSVLIEVGHTPTPFH